ncbi:hypothetical protein BU25DRAFT_36071 [Macroventuria anomochaeta]|uniref:Uncharacterized protein n=1 Tax=Macroventuria anomochaeta TaxID=301207 RepID=A0ACB6S505_9PLEO|nr:uncharacterized protein BU25DRAFT_36071 [Macroventuria anomochaeta]KAF2628448.1 hypothetical protein BU25DRAFT_36071 [Macroventuria anomochaeta]
MPERAWYSWIGRDVCTRQIAVKTVRRCLAHRTCLCFRSYLCKRQISGLGKGKLDATKWFTKLIIQGIVMCWAWCQLHLPSHHLIRVVKG